MQHVDRITARKWRSLSWRNPREDLVRLGAFTAQMQRNGVFPTHDDLRDKELKCFLEAKQGALFAHFIGEVVVKLPIAYAMYEAEDYDCVLWWRAEKKSFYAPVQLKELVPTDLNPRATLEGELEKLGKYGKSSNTVVAVHMNQSGPVVYSDIRSPELKLGGIWLYSSITPDQSRWFLYGDILRQPRGYEINWPITIE